VGMAGPERGGIVEVAFASLIIESQPSRSDGECNNEIGVGKFFLAEFPARLGVSSRVWWPGPAARSSRTRNADGHSPLALTQSATAAVVGLLKIAFVSCDFPMAQETQPRVVTSSTTPRPRMESGALPGLAGKMSDNGVMFISCM
jgi:hypothetical protein